MRRYNYKKRDGWTDGQLDRQTDVQTGGGTTDRLWDEINIPFFLKNKAGIITASLVLFALHILKYPLKIVIVTNIIMLTFFSKDKGMLLSPPSIHPYVHPY